MRGPAGMVVPAILLLAAGLVAAQDQGKRTVDDEELSPLESADLPPSAYTKGERPAAVERVFDAHLSKVWKEMLKTLEEEDLFVVTSDQGTGLIQTALKVFDEVQGPFRNVAIKPPLLREGWPIWQPPFLNRGRYSLEILIRPDDGTRVSIRPYIEGRARHVVAGTSMWAERYSNGTIEQYFLDKLGERLD